MTLEELALARNEAAEAVNAWMRSEGQNGNLRTNSQAPMWAKYEAAQAALDIALTAVSRC